MDFDLNKLGDDKIVEMLLNQRAEPNTATNEGETPLFAAAYMGNDRIVELLMDKWADAKKTAVDGTTPLHAAAIGGNRRVAQKLIDKFVDVNAVTRDGITPLHLAALYGMNWDGPLKNRKKRITNSNECTILGNRDIVELLINNRADVNKRSNAGITPLQSAMRNGK